MCLVPEDNMFETLEAFLGVFPPEQIALFSPILMRIQGEIIIGHTQRSLMKSVATAFLLVCFTFGSKSDCMRTWGSL